MLPSHHHCTQGCILHTINSLIGAIVDLYKLQRVFVKSITPTASTFSRNYKNVYSLSAFRGCSPISKTLLTSKFFLDCSRFQVFSYILLVLLSRFSCCVNHFDKYINNEKELYINMQFCHVSVYPMHGPSA